MIRLSEIYHSFQGEGPNTGKPTLFVRFVGCNLKCPGWPCDTQHAIDPKLYRKDMKVLTPDEFVDAVMAEWKPYETICFTGGEPALQNAQDLKYALRALKHHTDAPTEMFTNGTLPWDDTFRNYQDNYIDTIIVDWKLPGSGEVLNARQQLAFQQNLGQLYNTDAIKFTVKDRADFDAAIQAWADFYGSKSVKWGNHPKVYCGPVWGSVTAEEVAQWVMDEQLPWRLNVQVHKFVWQADKRGV